MIIRRNGIYYLNADEINSLSKTEEGKKKLESFGDYQQVRWYKMNPTDNSNRASRRQKVRDPLFGFMKNNAQDRTRHKRF